MPTPVELFFSELHGGRLVSGSLDNLAELMDASYDSNSRLLERFFHESGWPVKPGGGDKLALFGAGEIGGHLARFFRENNRPADFFCDNNPSLWGTKVNGLPVWPLERLLGFDNLQVVPAVFDAGTRHRIIEQLTAAGLAESRIYNADPAFDLYDGPIMVRSILDRLRPHVKDMETAFSFLEDEASKLAYASSLRALWMFPRSLSPWACQHYFVGGQYWGLDSYNNLDEAVYVDCGAFWGDTVSSFLMCTAPSSVRKIYAFEPYSPIFEKLKANAAVIAEACGLREGVIECLNYALGDKPETLYLNSISEPRGMIMVDDNFIIKDANLGDRQTTNDQGHCSGRMPGGRAGLDHQSRY